MKKLLSLAIAACMVLSMAACSSNSPSGGNSAASGGSGGGSSASQTNYPERTITMICATAFPKVFNDAPGANEIGTFLIYIFFAVIGAPASIMSIITQAPLLLVYALIIVACNMLITLIFGKIFKFSLEEIILASNANIGGPTTAAAMAISKGWNKLVGPVLLIGTLGYVLGNYYGVLVGNLLR